MQVCPKDIYLDIKDFNFWLFSDGFNLKNGCLFDSTVKTAFAPEISSNFYYYSLQMINLIPGILNYN